jgi:XTP/dITP diphosphohydrolase
VPEPVRVVLATRNRNKLEEIAEAVDLAGIRFESLEEHPDAPEVDEDGETFEENARKKAVATARATGLPALADDSGLVVDALGGEPGVRSARFAGENAGDAANRARLRRSLAECGPGPHAARFICVLALARPAGECRTVEGRCEGTIVPEERGELGFGYDPLFVPEGETRTFAQMSRAEKSGISHRGRALVKARELLRELVAEAGARGARVDARRARGAGSGDADAPPERGGRRSSGARRRAR